MKAASRVLGLMLVTLVLPACLIPSSKDKYDRTPNGWHVHWKDQGTLATGLHDKTQLLALFDAAMARGIDECAALMNQPATAVYDRAKDYDTLYTLVDNAWFRVDGSGSADSPTASYASGIVYGRSNLTVAFYSLHSLPNGTPLPADAPAWTVHAGVDHPDQTYFGEEVDGQQYPALGYELTHYWGNP